MQVVPPKGHEPQVSIDCIACRGSGKVIGPACVSDGDGPPVEIPIGSICPFCKGTKRMTVQQIAKT